jgi:hypothetical protein
MPLTEDQALTLTNTMGELDPDRKIKATRLLGEYKTAQADAGLPAFPALERKKADQDAQFYSMFDKLENVDAVAPGMATITKASADPEADRMLYANASMIARYTGKEVDEVLNRYSDFMPAFATQVLKTNVADDRAFFAAASGRVAKDRQRDTMRDDAASMALLSASDIAKTGVVSLNEWKQKYPDATDSDVALFLRTYNTLAREIPAYGLFKGKTTNQAISSFVDGTATPDDIQEFAELPSAKRNLVVASMFARARETGEKSTTGLGAQTGKSVTRLFQDMVGGVRTNEALLNTLEGNVKSGSIPFYEQEIGEGKIDSKEKADRVVKSLLEKQASNLAGPLLGGKQMQGELGKKKLDPEEAALLAKAVQTSKKVQQLTRVIEQAERTADPVKSALASGVGSTIAFAAAAVAPQASLMVAGGYANMEYDQLRADNPNMSVEMASTISAVSGAAMMALDKINVSFVSGKLPSLRNFINGGMTSTLVKRGLFSTGEQFVFQQIQEGGQDMTTAVVQELASRLTEDAPQVDWKDKWANWYAERPDVAIGTFPIMLLGTGVASYNDINGADRLFKSKALLQQSGYLENDAIEVVDLAAKGDTAGALDKLQEAFPRRSAEEVKKSPPAETVDGLDDLMQTGALPKFQMTSKGIRIEMPDGTVQVAKDWQEARALAPQYFTDSENAEIDAVAQLADHWLGQDKGFTEKVDYDPQDKMTRDTLVNQNVVTEAEARQAAIVSGRVNGLTPEVALANLQAILGYNVTDTKALVKESATRLGAGADVLTLTEEITHGRLRVAWSTGAITMDETKQFIALSERILGEKLLNGETEMDYQEAVGAIMAAEVLGSRKDGTRLPAGVISRGLRASMQTRVGGKWKNIVDVFRALFKQVFQRARAIQKAKADGTLGTDYQGFVDKLLGADPLTVENNQTAQVAEEVFSESLTAEPASTMVGKVVSFEGYTGRLQQDGVRYTISTPERDIEITGEDLVNVVEQDVQPDSVFTPVAGKFAIQDQYGNEFVPANKRFSRSQTKEGLRVRNVISNKLFNLSGEQGANAWKAMVEAGVSMEQAQGNPGKVLFSMVPLEFHTELQSRLEKVLDQNPEKKALAFLAAKKKLAELAANNGELFNYVRSKSSINTEADKRESAKFAELVKDGIPREDALRMAKEEAKQWATLRINEIPSGKQVAVEAVRTLEAIAMAFPKDMRGAAVQGLGTLANTSNPHKLLEKLTKVAEKLNNEMDVWLKQHFEKKANKLLNSFMEESRAGKAPKSKVGAEAADLLSFAKEVSKLPSGEVITKRIKELEAELTKGRLSKEDETKIKALLEKAKGQQTVDALLSKLDATVADPTTTPEAYDDAVFRSNIVELVGDMKGADAARMEAAYKLIERIYVGGYIEFSEQKSEWKQQLAKIKADLETATGASSDKAKLDLEVNAAETFDKTFLGIARKALLNISSLDEVVSYLFGKENVGVLLEMERKAANEYEDAKQELDDGVNVLFTKLGGSLLAGQNLLYRLQQASINHSKVGNISELEAANWLMAWRQKGGKRHMESDGWTQEQVDEMRNALSPEAFVVMDYMTQDYSNSYARYNAVYEKRFGVKLPKQDLYAPLTTATETTNPNAFAEDPITQQQTYGSVTQPSALSSRSATAKAKIRKEDALSVFIAHKKKMEYWVSHYDIAKVMESMTGNRDFMAKVVARGGTEAPKVLRIFQQTISQGGFIEAASSLAAAKALSGMANRAAGSAILGRISTLLIQSSQLAAASVQMPTGAFVKGWSEVMANPEMLKEAFNSPFMQRRIASLSPLMRDAINRFDARKPNAVKMLIPLFGKLLGGTDALMTSVTYAVLKNYHTEQAAALGLKGAEADSYIASETERKVEQVAQPTRTSAKSAVEITYGSTTPGKILMPFATESRQKLALLAWAAVNGKTDPARLVRVSFLVFVVNGLGVQIIKNLWRDATGDEDEKRWEPGRLALLSLAGPIMGTPGFNSLTESYNLISGSLKGAKVAANHQIKEIIAGNYEFTVDDMKDVELILQGIAPFSETATAIVALERFLKDTALFTNEQL